MKIVMSADMKRDFERIACDLSPENLTCDGEASTAYVRKRSQELRAKWAALEKKLGKKVTEEDLYSNRIKVVGELTSPSKDPFKCWLEGSLR